VHINVGSEETPFDVHLELLCDCSPYFDRLFKDRTVKSLTENPIRFPDDNPDVFSELISWMYLGKFSNDLSYHTGLFFCQLWVLAGKLEMLELQNSVILLLMKGINEKADSVVDIDMLNYIYTNTLLGSPLRLLVVDTWAQRAQFLKDREILPRTFLEDLCCALIERRKSMEINENKILRSKQQYFVHPSLNDKHLVPLRGEIMDVPQRASSTQMQNRRLKSPSSRIHRSSPSPSINIMTPVSTVADGDAKGDISESISQLQI
jgi:hypothetical protein